MNRNQEAILDLIKACNLITKFCANLDQQFFLDDEKTQSSVLYQIVIIGEAVNRLTPDFIAKYPQILFNAIRGMRNRVVHEYKEVDVQILWEVTQSNIPELLALVESIDKLEN
ncbi:HepT-like ribonuclease domain-containing protein [Cyanobacterium aponinum AL20118]|uniref:HepT-like ribonuclease domain-containing protein n=1 Tax=Cyanobacterium aponinum AL20115 TaxID=3090662 RepID=A0AAF1C0U8_9CHRO|nr:HepT-like ribonuclease domain-containing protein [Cyanobacterium aponinum]WPF87952.1 HepT-like ribonuclease domain-containing protein [Cyanobacterium aponinum AL20115]